MNNFKKLLASAMALSMVTSVLPAVSTNVSAATCNIVERDFADTLVEAIATDVRAAGYTLSNIPNNATTNADGDGQIAWTNTSALLDGISAGATIWEVLEASPINTVTTVTGSASTIIENRVNNCSGEDEDATYLAGFVTAVNDLNTIVDELHTKLTSGDLSDGVIDSDEWTDAEELYNKVVNALPYLDNVATTKYDEDKKEQFRDDAAVLEDLVNDYKDEFYDDFAENYITDLEEKFAKELELNDDGKYQGRSLSALKSALEKEMASDEYALYGDEDEVVDIIDAVEAVISDLETVDEILDSSSDAARALRAVRSKVNNLAGKTDEDALKVIDTFTAEDIENVQTYVEEVVNEFYTYETRQRSSGRYYVREEGTDLAAYIDNDDVNTNVRKLLTTILDADQKSEDTVYDVLVDTDTTKVTKADLIAIVEEAEGVELKWTYTTTEVDLVTNALDALERLLPTDADGDYTGEDPYNLNAREERTLKAERTRLERIWSRMENAEAEIIVTKDWWVFENGQWVFYQDGRTVSNVWVADHNNDWYYAGANGVMLTNSWIARDSSLSVWYYVGADGKMVTNTVVDGYTINANGEWHA